MLSKLPPLNDLRILLFPFSLIYGLIVITRNFLFDKKVFNSVSFNIPVIGVGNLSAGGTGKTPMVEYLIKLLQYRYKVATLSRGYKRETTGYLVAHAQTTAAEIGDEPMQFHTKFPHVAVAVGEERVAAIPQLLHDEPDTQVLILDDSFQHRWVKPGLNILLTEYSRPFTKDFFLPVGNLRDQKSSYKRADVIVVTKCPAHITDDKLDQIRKGILPLPHQHVFFTTTAYGCPYHIITNLERDISLQDEVLVVCGIANPKPFADFVRSSCKAAYMLSYPDHHSFSFDDLKEIGKKFETIQSKQKIIITTEKDAVRLLQFKSQMVNLPLYVLPTQHQFIAGGGIQFDELVNTFIETL